MNQGKPKLIAMPRRRETPRQQVVSQFISRLAGIENFVILAQTKAGEMMIFPCVDQDPGAALFIDTCKARMVEDAMERLTEQQSVSPAV